MVKFKKKVKAQDKENKPKTKEKLANALELPQEILLNVPKIVAIGNKSIVIQNYKGVYLFEDERIKIGTAAGIIVVCGRKLKIIEINSEDLRIEGKVISIEFEPMK